VPLLVFTLVRFRKAKSTLSGPKFNVFHCGNWQKAMRQDKQKLAKSVSESFYMQEHIADFRMYTSPLLALYFGPQWLDRLNLSLKK